MVYGLMILWLVFALMTAAAIFAVLWPLARAHNVQAGSELEVYRDQLDEIERDRAAGLIGAAEADAARVEVSRRLIAAADAAEFRHIAVGSPRWRRRAAAIAGLVLLPVGAIALYLTLGSPQLPGEPLQARLRAIHNDRSIASLVAQVETHLAQNPNDARGYAVLAPVYLQLGRFQDAVNARRKVLALGGETADRQADLGEALTAAANGIVTADAKVAFERAVALDASEPKARFYIGVAAEQDGDRAKAAAIWQEMLKSAPADAPWVATVTRALAEIGVAPNYAACGRGRAACCWRAGPECIRCRRRFADERAGPQHDGARHGRAAGRPTQAERRRYRGLAAAAARLCGAQRARQGAGRGRRCTARARQRSRQAAPDRRHHQKPGARKLTRKQRRLILIGSSLGVLALAVGLVLSAMRGAIVFFQSPTDVVEHQLAPGTRIRIGGLVKTGSIERGDNLRIRFAVTDGKHDIPVHYQGIVPDLFREGQGVVAEGKLEPGGTFAADTVLAKHDERYMPKEVVDALKKSGRWQEGADTGAAK